MELLSSTEEGKMEPRKVFASRQVCRGPNCSVSDLRVDRTALCSDQCLQEWETSLGFGQETEGYLPGLDSDLAQEINDLYCLPILPSDLAQSEEEEMAQREPLRYKKQADLLKEQLQAKRQEVIELEKLWIVANRRARGGSW
jgi:hypothetical protein